MEKIINKSRLELGKQILATLDPTTAAGLETAFNDICPDLGKFVLEFAWGDIYSREGLDLRSREIASISAIVTKGGLEPQLKAHIGYALKAGCSREEVVEVMLHLMIFAGMTSAISGILAAREVFAVIDAESK